MEGFSKKDVSKAYVHYVAESPADVGWPNSYEFYCIKSEDDLQRVFSEEIQRKGESLLMSFDTETTGLNPDKDHIVGFSFSFDGKAGYYVPLHHFDISLDSVKALGVVHEAMSLAKTVFFFNYRFDARFMEKAGFDMSKVSYYDVAVGAYLADTNMKAVGLKWSAKHFLGIRMDTFEETMKDTSSIVQLGAEDITFYAASDAIVTYKLAFRTLQYYKEAGVSGALDNLILFPLMRYEDMSTRISEGIIREHIKQIEARMNELELLFFKEAGRAFNLASNRELGEVLLSLGLHTNQYTATGQMAVSMPVLQRMGGSHPFVKALLEYKSIAKYLNSYLTPVLLQLEEEAKERGYRLRFSYLTTSVPTGRFASSGDKKNGYFAHFNIQSTPKPTPKNYYCKYTGGPDFYDPIKNPHSFGILGWEFSDQPISSFVVEGTDPMLNIRQMFYPEREDMYWVSMDFSAQELRGAAIYSREPVWVNAFLLDGDIHKETAEKVFGKENYNKALRKKAKMANFLILYGGSAYSLANKLEMPEAEALDFYNRYKSGLPTLFRWIQSMQNKAKREGTVRSLFGRPRRVKYYLESSEKSMRAFGFRTAVNTVIQGLGADLLKRAMVLLWREIFSKEEFSEDVRFQNTVHDEINFGIKKERVLEIVPKIQKCMEFQFPDSTKLPNVKFKVSLEIGHSWGSCIPFHIIDGVLCPDYEDVSE